MPSPFLGYTTTHKGHLYEHSIYTPFTETLPVQHNDNAVTSNTTCPFCTNVLYTTDFECVYCQAPNPQYSLLSRTEQDRKLREQPLDEDHVNDHSLEAPGTNGLHSREISWPDTETHFASTSRNLAPSDPPPPSYDDVASRVKRSVSMKSGVSFDTAGTLEGDIAQPSKKKAARQAAPLPGWEGENPRCQMCPKRKAFKATVFNRGEFCNKHTRKNMKELEANKGRPVEWTDDEGTTTTDLAMDMVYPAVSPLDYTGELGDDWMWYTEQAHQNAVVKGFINATNQRYTDAMDPGPTADEKERHVHENFLKQQRDYDHKPWEEASIRLYTNKWILTRMRLLFLVILTYHRGGRSIYPIGGANNGYGEDKTLTMTERIVEITEILRRDKRVVMDVIEGRGVAALAANPGKFEERKTSNFKCNAKKKRKLEASAGQSTNSEHQPLEAIGTGSVPSLANDEDDSLGSLVPALQAPKSKAGPKRRKIEPTGIKSSSLQQNIHENTTVSTTFDPLSATPHTATTDMLSMRPSMLDQNIYSIGYNSLPPNFHPNEQHFPATDFGLGRVVDSLSIGPEVDGGEDLFDSTAGSFDLNLFLKDPDD